VVEVAGLQSIVKRLVRWIVACALLGSTLWLAKLYAQTTGEVNRAGQLRYRSLLARDLALQGRVDESLVDLRAMEALRELIRARHSSAPYFAEPSFAAFAEQVEQRQIPSFEVTMRHVRAADALVTQLAESAAFYLYGTGILLLVALGLTALSMRALAQRNEQLRELQANLELLSTTDALTGAGNRRKLVHALETMHSNASTFIARSYTLILVDLDHFKDINDQHGHPKGDEVLAACAALLKRVSCAEVYRYGGEEFAIVLVTSLEEATRTAESLRSALAATPLAGIGVTASFGVAQSRPYDAPTTTLARADRALYVAKKEGRDRVSTERHAPATLIPANELPPA
jgi:diguanylate cyclase (GGDEF)-like protein